MSDPIDAATLRAALRQARRQRAQFRAGHPVAPDTAYLILHPPGEAVLDVVALRFPESPYLGPPGRPRYRTMVELGRELETLASRLPQPQSGSEPVASAHPSPPGPEGESQREFVAACFAHNVPGTGAELLVEATVAADGRPVWESYRVPFDGAPVPLGGDGPFDDAAFERAFGRPLTLAAHWAHVLRTAMDGTATSAEVEPGYWIYAAPKGDRTLEPMLTRLVSNDAHRVVARIAAPDRAGLAQLEPGYDQWAPEAAAALRDGSVQAGAVLDLARARERIEAALEHRGIELTDDVTTGGALVIAQDSVWPVDPALLSTAAVHLARSVTETAASFASLVGANLASVRRYVEALRAARPGCKVVVHRTRAVVQQSDQHPGESIDLMTAPIEAPPGTPGFELDVRFACDPLPSGVDPTRVCRCGAPAHLAVRLVERAALEPARKSGAEAEPWVLDSWPPDNPHFCAVVTVVCASHQRFAPRVELQRAGLTEASVARGIFNDAALETFEVTAMVQPDPAGNQVIVAHGTNAASIALDEGLLAALDVATGRTLTGVAVGIELVPPDGVCVYAQAADPKWVEALVARLVELDGLRAAPGTPRSLGWTTTMGMTACGNVRVPRSAPSAPGVQPGTQPATQPGPRRGTPARVKVSRA